ncbi:MAG TPA: tetratricopeptide repeat protein [Bryobacteraceae bacterium]|nr:tetratricopeptide repeat protein [Bryobacteraceae bacterium]
MARKRPAVGSEPAVKKMPPVRKARHFSLPDAAIWASIFCATLIAYSPALRGGLVWDDASHVTSPALQSLHGLWRIWFDLRATQQYYPLLHSAFWMEHRIWGDAVLGYHLTNVFLHAASACLVVRIVRRLSLPGAWLAGLVFVLHPVCVEAVAWVSEQKSTLSGVFYLAAALVYLRFDRTRSRPDYLWASVLFVLALASKTVTATLPAALLVVFWWQRGRLGFRQDVRPLLPWFALGAAAGLSTAWVERTYIGATGADFTLTLTERFLLAGRAIWFYAGKIVWPASLIFTYPRWKIDAGIWWQYLFPAGVLSAAIGFWFLARRYRGPLAGFLIFIGTLFPVLGFLNVYPFIFSYVADHFAYLASLAIIVPICAVAVGQATGHGVTWVRALSPLLLPTLAVLTFRQAGTYADAETLYRATLARNPASWMARTNLGVALAETPSRLAEAIAEYQAALRLRPDDAQTHANLGNALAQMPGRLPDAIAEFRTALRLKPNLVQTRNDFGVALSQIPGRLPEAIAEFQAALRLKPDYAEAHGNLGVALTQIPGRLPDAIAEFRTALRLKPDYADAHNNLARALAQTPASLQEAIAEYEAALRANAGDAETHFNLGVALAQVPGRLPDAVAEFRAALRIRPDYLDAHHNLGNALSQIPGRLPDAIAQFQAALRIQPDDAEVHSDLGIALAQLPGRLPDAIAEFQAALRIQPGNADARENLANALVQTPGRVPEAIVEYQKTLRLRPDDAPAHNGLGVALAQTPGRLPEAIAQFQAALRLQPDYAEARNNLTRACPRCLSRTR